MDMFERINALTRVLLGNYMAESFAATADGHGGNIFLCCSLVVEPGRLIPGR
jgi:hypothetical protein